MSKNKKQSSPFSMGANLGDGWGSDNKQKTQQTKKILAVDKHELRIKKEKRKGKTITLAGEFFHSKEIKQKLSGELKKKLSIGGSVNDEWLEFQGDVGSKLKDLLEKKGYNFK